MISGGVLTFIFKTQIGLINAVGVRDIYTSRKFYMNLLKLIFKNLQSF